MDPVTGAVVMVGLKIVGQPAVELVKDFIGKVFGPSADAVGEVIAHPIQDWHRRRVERASQMLLDAAVLVEESGHEPQAVPPRVLWPLLQNGSLEEDTELQKYWVSLLATASLSPDDVPPAYPSILSELSPGEARTLNWLYEKGHPNVESIGAIGFFGDISSYTYLLAFENLNRLRLIIPERLVSGGDRYDVVSLTPLAIALMDACKGKNRHYY
jgi:hypothetical protein